MRGATYFYGIVCGNPACGRVFYENPFLGDDLADYVPMPCPGCGQVHEDTEPTMCESETVLGNRADSRCDATLIAEAERRLRDLA